MDRGCVVVVVVAQARDLAGLKESGTFPAFAPMPRGSARHGTGDVERPHHDRSGYAANVGVTRPVPLIWPRLALYRSGIIAK